MFLLSSIALSLGVRTTGKAWCRQAIRVCTMLRTFSLWRKVVTGADITSFALKVSTPFGAKEEKTGNVSDKLAPLESN